MLDYFRLRKFSIRSVSLILFTVIAIPSADTQTIIADHPEVIFTPSETQKIGIFGWPDSNVVSFLRDGTYYLFASNANLTATQALATPNINDLKSNHRLLKVHPLAKGGSDAFDRDYAGGGTIYYDPVSRLLIQLYHGEYWYGGGSQAWLPAYTSLGIAVSKDFGQTWKKLGQALSGSARRENRCQNDIGNGSLIYKSDGYLYVYYTDLDTTCANPSMAIARARLSDIVSAAKKGKFPRGSGSVFLKFHNGSFSEPGVIDSAKPALGGGQFSPLFANGDHGWPAMVSVAYNKALQKYVMVYIVDWHGLDLSRIAIRFSPDGLAWSEPGPINVGESPFYPSLLNTDGGDPNILGSSFYIYFVNPFPGLEHQQFMRVKLTVSELPGASNPAPGH